MLKNHVIIKKDYSFKEIDNLKKSTFWMGNNIQFEDDIWECDKLVRNATQLNHSCKIYFTKIPEKYKKIAKVIILVRYNERKKLSTLRGNTSGISTFLKFLEKNYKGIDILHVNKSIISDYYKYLDDKYTSTFTKHGYCSTLYIFFDRLINYTEANKKNPVKKDNPFKTEDIKSPDKYIPEHITSQLDCVFKDEESPIPDYIRTFYWIARSIPLRISEIIGMNIECIKAYQDSHAIFIPSWKQNGGYIEPEINAIHLSNNGHGAYLLDLIKKQQEEAFQAQNKLDEEETGLLFTYRKRRFHYKLYERTGQIKFSKEKDVIILKPEIVTYQLNRICERCGISDKEGRIYTITSHQFRHTAITDRLYEGFSPIEVKELTSHKNEEMIIKSYYHSQKEKLKEKQRLVHDRKKENEDNKNTTEVYFKGKILKLDNTLEERLLRNPRAHKLKYGICSDITGCKNKTYDCLNCDYFIPNAEDLDYFEEEVKQWTRKIGLFKEHPALKENAMYNLRACENIIKKIKSIINTKQREECEVISGEEIT
ncbi:MAG: tyrosine-type recombinase/integrase [Clostridiaceae bacterium]|nr:tyrosine-type recombinase/integrase [Clostridiaceae bacterium]